MNNANLSNLEVISVLKECIINTLKPLVSNKCILLDAPYYHNIGDVLIWAGEKALIEELGSQCIYTASYDTCKYPRIDKDVTILFQGGGNIGDLYHEHAEFLLKVIEKYPNNRIIVCSQSVYYQDHDLEEKDFQKIAGHKDLYFCGRDKVTAELLKKYIGDRALCLPDMAFCIPPSKLNVYKKKVSKDSLYIDRIDCEKANISINTTGEKHDWPVFEFSFRRSTFINKILSKLSKSRLPIVGPLINVLWDKYAQSIFFNAMIKEGVEFISSYRYIETTRLHGCILAILLDKEINFIDNSYGKNKRFYEAWLTDLNTLTFTFQEKDKIDN